MAEREAAVRVVGVFFHLGRIAALSDVPSVKLGEGAGPIELQAVSPMADTLAETLA
ncbi:MAG: hypothetical protein H7Z15_14940 [Rhizobacter sp.]|nr:hypothetical protein [Rhizobacter sp.]